MGNIRENFCKKISKEYHLFKELMLKNSKREIFDSAYKIEMFENLCDILIMKSDDLSDEILVNLLYRSGVLDFLYECWLKKDDNLVDDLMRHVEEELEKRQGSAERKTYGNK